MIDKNKNTCVYCKFSNNAYEFMKRYSDLIGSSIADFVRQAVGEKIMMLGKLEDLKK